MSESNTRFDRLLAFGTGALVVVWLYLTAPAIGYARDEGFYFQAATEYGKWLELLVTHPGEAITRRAVDAHFRINAEHPSLMKLLFALSYEILHKWLDWVETPGMAFRLPGILMLGLATSLIVLWGTRAVSRWAGVVAGLLFITMPRVFHHAHLACFDVPVVATILLTVYAYFMATTTRRTSWILAVGCCYGLALDTKHNAWTLPLVLFIHLILTQWHRIWVGPSRERLRVAWPLISMLTIGPLVLFLLWPWLWFDTLDRLRYWVEFHLRHDYYNMEFLGQTYHRPPMPRGYAWVMTVATVPLTTLLFSGAGLVVAIRHAFASAGAKRRRIVGHVAADCGVERLDAASRTHCDIRTSTDSLLLLCLLSGYAPWWSTSTPIFGGTKHWLTAYPFLCLFAARGFEALAAELRQRFARRKEHPFCYRALCCGVTVACLSGPAAITLDSLPFGLSAYTPLVGGAKGAATLGLNRTFWGYTSIELADEMSRRLPRGGRVFVHDTALQSWNMHQRDGTIARNLVPTLNAAYSELGLYHYEPHMGRVEYQLWEAYGTTTPAAVATFGGVPVVWLYARPEHPVGNSQ